MCIIIFNRNGILDDSLLNQASQGNPDGGGLMYAEQNIITSFKSLDNKEVIEKYKAIRKYYQGPVFLHFRIATDGDVNEENCHPYPISNHSMLMHNGILSHYSNRNTNMSDTRLFIMDILDSIPRNVLYTNAFRKLIKQAIGTFNKFAILCKNGEWMIINEDQGHWDSTKSNWFSNNSYKPVRKSKNKKNQFYSSTAVIQKHWPSDWRRKQREITPPGKSCEICGTYVIGMVTDICHSCSFGDDPNEGYRF